jgi:hypothetical protein
MSGPRQAHAKCEIPLLFAPYQKRPTLIYRLGQNIYDRVPTINDAT